MDLFENLVWQSKPAKPAFEPYRNHFGNGSNGSVGSAFFVAEHKLSATPRSPSAFISFEDGQDGPFSSFPRQNSGDNLSDEDFGDFESVPAVTAMRDSSPEWVPPLTVSQLMLQVHGAALPSALQSRVNSADLFASSHPRSSTLDSKLEAHSDAAARNSSTPESTPIPSTVHTDKFTGQIGGSQSDTDDVDWDEFLRPSVKMGTITQNPDLFPIDPKPIDGSSRSGPNLQENFSEKQITSLFLKSPDDLMLDRDLSSSTGLSLMSEPMCRQNPSSDYENIRGSDLRGSSDLQLQGTSLDLTTFGCRQDKVAFAGSVDATLLASSRTVITKAADAEDQIFGTAKSTGFSFQDTEVSNQQTLEGFNSKQIKVLLDDKENLKSLEGVTSQISAAASVQAQLAYIQSWNALASVCAYELAHGRALWQHAKLAGLCSSLISHSQGRSYFTALGQIHAVSLILEAALQLYRSWVEVASVQGKVVQATLERCKKDWSDVKDAVYSAILEFEGSSNLLTSWKSLERLCSIDEAAEMISFERESQMLCRLSLLPLHKNLGVPAVKWGEHQYFLPIANLWANCISTQPPWLPPILS